MNTTEYSPVGRLLVATVLAAAVAGAMIVWTTTNLPLWKYVLGVVGLAVFVLAGLTTRK